MLKSIEGIYSDGEIALWKRLPTYPTKRRLLSLFWNPARSIYAGEDMDETQAADLRGRLIAFASCKSLVSNSSVNQW